MRERERVEGCINIPIIISVRFIPTREKQKRKPNSKALANKIRRDQVNLETIFLLLLCKLQNHPSMLPFIYTALLDYKQTKLFNFNS